MRALRTVGETDDDLVSPLAGLRMRIMLTVPSVRGYGLQVQADAQREIARHLATAFPDQLDDVHAAALTGAFIGAISGALQAILDRTGQSADPAALHTALHTATDVALTPWQRQKRSVAAHDCPILTA